LHIRQDLKALARISQCASKAWITSLATPGKIRELQIKLYRKAKNEPGYRFYMLYDKMYRGDILSHAYELARANQGAPGVDGQSFTDIESRGLGGVADRHPTGIARQDVSSPTGATGDDPEGRRRRAAARDTEHTGPGGADRGQDRAGADIRGGSGTKRLWAPTEAERARRDPESA
jgi:hypothetical protein